MEKALAGISQRMMTLTLRRLERDGYVLRHIEPTVPPSVTYELSDLGHSFSTQVALLVTWSREHKSKLEQARSTFDRNMGSRNF
ncbi:winged helix-turn-helix transcriptional regulator [Vibrio spartinae]|uniref:winged helix-turn-helix transcriptional regulator n=1 Tax=Vibrio spartinae TaxID=1918945 RepID=UPI00351FC8D7